VKTLQTAIIGAGRLGGFHAQKLAADNRCNLLAIADPNAETRKTVATNVSEANGAAVGTASHYNELLGKIDAAIVAAPTTLHYEICKDLLNAGVHTLVEKPICTRVDEADELVDLAKEKGCVFSVGQIERFNPAFLPFQRSFCSAKYIEARRCGPFPFRSFDVGVVLDLMIHDLDLILSFVRSPIATVEAFGTPVLGPHEDIAGAHITFENGCIASLDVSRVSYEAERTMTAICAHSFGKADFATRTFETIQPSPTVLRRKFDLAGMSQEEIEHCKENLTIEHLPRTIRTFDAVDALANQDAEFLSAIIENRKPRVTGKAGRDALAAANRVLASIEQRDWDTGFQPELSAVRLAKVA